MKAFRVLLLILCFGFSLFSTGHLAFADYYPGSSTTIKVGDVLVTNNTSSWGLTGHAGIVISTTGTVASIAGAGYYPAASSISTWFSKYPNEKVVRYSGADATAAGNWAANYLRYYSSAYYDLSPLDYMYSTYCSKIVWDAYHYGTNYDLPTVYSGTLMISIVKPYDLPTAGTVVLKKGSW